jgi:hypothetical protein
LTFLGGLKSGSQAASYFSKSPKKRRESMSLIICATDRERTTLCSEDRAGITDAAGNFIPVDDGHIKSIHLTPEIVFGVLGPVSIANRFKTLITALGCLSFDRLAEIIPTVARALMEGVDAKADLNLLLTGWDGKKIRTVVWNTRQDDFQAAEEVAHDDIVYWVLGTSQEAHDIAGSLLMNANAPDLREVFGKLADTFPQIGRGLDVHTVTRPTDGSNPNATADHLTTIPYHASAFRTVTATSRGGAHTAPTGGDAAYITVASFTVNIPSGFSQYKGTYNLSIGGTIATIGTVNGRLNIGSHNSNVITFNIPATSASGTVTVTGLTGGTTITVNVQVQGVGNDGVYTITGSFGQNQYTDQDVSNLA